MAVCLNKYQMSNVEVNQDSVSSASHKVRLAHVYKPVYKSYNTTYMMHISDQSW